jgi:hypothetical protein
MSVLNVIGFVILWSLLAIAVGTLVYLTWLICVGFRRQDRIGRTNQQGRPERLLVWRALFGWWGERQYHDQRLGEWCGHSGTRTWRPTPQMAATALQRTMAADERRAMRDERIAGEAISLPITTNAEEATR